MTAFAVNPETLAGVVSAALGEKVKRIGHNCLHAPGLATTPAGCFEIIGNGCQRVGFTRPDVRAAIPIPVPPVAEIG